MYPVVPACMSKSCHFDDGKCTAIFVNDVIMMSSTQDLITSMQVSFVGFQPVRTLEHMVAAGQH